MIINYVSKIVEEDGVEKLVECIIDGVEDVQETDEEIKILHPRRGKYGSTIIPKKSADIHVMYLNNNDFKTMKRLI